MTDFHKKPGTPGDILKHHGVKGQKWGVRKKEESVGESTPQGKVSTNAQTKAYLAQVVKQQNQPNTAKQVEANLLSNKAKFGAKFEDASGPLGKQTPGVAKTSTTSKIKAKWNSLTPDQKVLVGEVAAVGVIVAGTAVLGAYNRHAILAMAGKPISAAQFNQHVSYSQVKTWGTGGHITKESLLRPAFELPAGHTFHRLTTSAAESGFREATYVTADPLDFDRYVTAFRHEKGVSDLYHVTFTTSAPTKVPNLTTVLSSLHDVLRSEGRSEVSEQEVMTAYTALSGSGWDTTRASSLISALKGKGFGAIVDEMDAGVIGEHPLVYFNPGSAGPKTTVPLTKSAIEQSESQLFELLHRKV